MRLLGELSLQELVNGVNLLGELIILEESLRHESDLGNGLEIWSHHSHWSEESCEVVWQL